MTHDELTALWREAGCPWVQGMQCGGHVVDAVYDGEPYFDNGEYALEGDPLPDWDHPMAEFAMMCAAEQAACSVLVFFGEPGDWECERACDSTVNLACAPTRIECALRVIIACREAE